MLSGSVSDGSSRSEGDEAPAMDEIDDMDVSMESDMERLLAVTNLDDDAAHAASPLSPVPEAAPEALFLRASAPPLVFRDDHPLHDGDAPASQASTAFLQEVVTLVDNSSVNELKALQLQTCVFPRLSTATERLHPSRRLTQTDSSTGQAEQPARKHHPPVPVQLVQRLPLRARRRLAGEERPAGAGHHGGPAPHLQAHAGAAEENPGGSAGCVGRRGAASSVRRG